MMPALVLGLAAFLANFDVTAVIVVLPAIAREMNLGVAGYAWVMDAYSLAFTGSLPIAGALADRHGRRRAMLTGNIVFAVASIACGLAWDGASLLLARALQGVGSAFVVTGGIALVAGAYPDEAARGRAFSWLGVLSGAAMALGPTVGGVVGSAFGWRWIFLANIPACALIAWWVPRLVCESREAAPRPLDYVGTALLTAALCVLVEALLHGRASAWRLGLGLSFSALLFASFVLQQKRRATPMFDPAVFLARPMLGIAMLLAAVSVGYWAVLVFLPQFLSAAFGWTAHAAGLALLAATLPMLVVPLLGSRLAERLGWRRHFALALAITALGNAIFVAALLAYGAQLPVWPFILAMALIGCGAALAHPQLSGAVVALAPAQQAGMASAMTIVMRQGAFAVGIAFLGGSLGPPDQPAAYVALFAIAAIAGLGGMLAALVCLPAKAGDADK
jgi:EmrB/QacA subfamily drug resistance transporter